MKYKPTEKQGKCNFQEWDKSSKSMKDCGQPSKILAGRNYICREHALSVLLNDKKAEMCRSDGFPICSPSEFVKICDGYAIEPDPEFDF